MSALPRPASPVDRHVELFLGQPFVLPSHTARHPVLVKDHRQSKMLLSAQWTVMLRKPVLSRPGDPVSQHCAHASVGDSQLPAACHHPLVTAPLATVGCCCYCHLELSLFCKMQTRREDGYWPEGKRAAMEDRYRDFPRPDHRYHDFDHRERGHYQEHVIDR